MLRAIYEKHETHDAAKKTELLWLVELSKRYAAGPSFLEVKECLDRGFTEEGRATERPGLNSYKKSLIQIEVLS